MESAPMILSKPPNPKPLLSPHATHPAVSLGVRIARCQARHFSSQSLQRSTRRPIRSHIDHLTFHSVACFFVFLHCEKYHRVPFSFEWLDLMGAISIKHHASPDVQSDAWLVPHCLDIVGPRTFLRIPC